MAKGFKHGAGGGADLNFEVKAYATEALLLAATPKENTIGVVTGTPVAGYIFDATQPEAITEGLVWIFTGSSSSAEFNALKKNGIMVYPISAKQYVSGNWEKKTVKSYMNGEWVEWVDGRIYRRGTEYVPLVIAANPSYPSQSHATKNAEYIDVGCAQGDYGGGAVYSEVELDLNGFTELKILCSHDKRPKFGITVTGIETYRSNKDIDWQAVMSLPDSKVSNVTEYTLTIPSGVSRGYFCAWAWSTNFKLYEARLV